MEETAALTWLAQMLRVQSGITLGPDKHYLLQNRLQPILQVQGISNLAALVERLRAGAASLVQEVVELMTTNETLFFRDSKTFDHLAAEALPQAAAARPAEQPVRIWSAGASCGQEAYSVAMTVAENPALLGGRPVRILGTDIATGPLGRARTGTYTQFEIQRGLAARRLLRHFDRVQDGWQIHQQLREMCQFTVRNLLEDPAPLGLFDIVFCRNVLIYFAEPTKRVVLAALAGQLAPHGWLYLGCAETAAGLCPELEQCTTGQPFYRLANACDRPG